MAEPDVLIIGAGLAGLCCAKRLHAAGVSFRLIDAADRPGGRVRTDALHGFLLDRGFQVLLTSYPEAQAQLDFGALELRAFGTGALVFADGEFYRLGDPWRQSPRHLLSPIAWFRALLAAAVPVGTLSDKLRIARLRNELIRLSSDDILLRPETTTRRALEARGFSEAIIQRFFEPFFGGVLLDPTLEASSRMFEFTFRMMALGRASLPARGMQAIPDQLAAALPAGSLQLKTRVDRLDGKAATLASGETVEARAVVVATDGWQASTLVGEPPALAARSTTCVYFAAPEPPIEGPLLVLNGEGRGLVNHLCVLSNVAPGYAPRGQALVSVSVAGQPGLDRDALIAALRSELRGWFSALESWAPLGVFRIARALPVVQPLQPSRISEPRPGVFLCGDYLATPSIQGAMESGRLAAEAVLNRA